MVEHFAMLRIFAYRCTCIVAMLENLPYYIVPLKLIRATSKSLN